MEWKRMARAFVIIFAVTFGIYLIASQVSTTLALIILVAIWLTGMAVGIRRLRKT